ncbi:MAG: hypothetical protein L3K13_08395, partial [Thermoplasmata archaeon]|nr:hypothetical protein [Thermoplasmata archaeon]
MARGAAEPQLFLVFGATGDLMQRKLLPSLYAVASGLRGGPKALRLLGCARQPMTDAAYRTLCLRSLLAAKAAPRPAAKHWLEESVSYHSLGAGTPEDYSALRAEVEAVEKRAGFPGNRVYYLALPEDAIAPTVFGLGGSGMH